MGCSETVALFSTATSRADQRYSLILLRRHKEQGWCAGRPCSRSDSLANLNDSDSDSEYFRGYNEPAAVMHLYKARPVSAKARVVQFKRGGGNRQLPAHRDQAVSEPYPAQSAGGAPVAGPILADSSACRVPLGQSTDRQDAHISSQQASARVISRCQAELKASTVRSSKFKPDVADWLELKRLPGDPKHFGTGTRLRVATLSGLL